MRKKLRELHGERDESIITAEDLTLHSKHCTDQPERNQQRHS